MRKRIRVMAVFGLLAGSASIIAQGIDSSAMMGRDHPSNGVLALTVRQFVEPPQGLTPGLTPPSEVWRGLIEITIKNTSQRLVHMEESNLSYELTMLDSLGKPVPRTEYGAQLDVILHDRSRMSVGVPVSAFDLPPGQEYTFKLSLKMFFEFQDGRDYTVKLRRWPTSMTMLDEKGARIGLRELSRTLKAKGRPQGR